MKSFVEFMQMVSEALGLMFGIILFGIGCIVLLWGLFIGPWPLMVAAFILIAIGAYTAAKNA